MTWRCCQTDFTASSFSGSRQISSMDGPVYFHLLSPNIPLVNKISSKQQGELKLILQTSVRHSFCNINHSMFNAKCINCSTSSILCYSLYYTPLTFTPSNTYSQLPIQTAASELAFTLLAHSGCLLLHLVL